MEPAERASCWARASNLPSSSSVRGMLTRVRTMPFGARDTGCRVIGFSMLYDVQQIGWNVSIIAIKKW